MSKTYPAALWITAAEVLCATPCELIYAYLVPSAAAAAVTLYDGLDTEGKIIATLEQAAKTSIAFDPPEPILCSQGLYAGSFTNVTGILVVYRPFIQYQAKET